MLQKRPWLLSIFDKNATQPEQIGFDVLHHAAVKTVSTLKSCLESYGITDCIMRTETMSKYEYHPLARIIQMSCYSVYIREALKFVPKVSTIILVEGVKVCCLKGLGNL